MKKIILIITFLSISLEAYSMEIDELIKKNIPENISQARSYIGERITTSILEKMFGPPDKIISNKIMYVIDDYKYALVFSLDDKRKLESIYYKFVNTKLKLSELNISMSKLKKIEDERRHKHIFQYSDSDSTYNFSGESYPVLTSVKFEGKK